MACFVAQSMRLIADQGDDHAVQVVEEHDQVESELDEGFLECAAQSEQIYFSKRHSKAIADLLVDIQFPENLCRIEEMLVLENPRRDELVSHVNIWKWKKPRLERTL
jgi:hypothetical protein